MSAPTLSLLGLAPIVARLDEQARVELRRIGSAGDLAAATAPSLVAAGAAATVLLVGAQAHPIKAGSGPFVQLLDVTIAVVVGVNLAGASGAAGIEKLELPVNAARAALFGWRHPDAQEPFASAGESLESFDGKAGVLFYRLDFTTSVLLRKT